MRKLLSMAVCLALTGGLCFSAAPACRVAVAESPRVNLAAGAAVSADSSYVDPSSNVWRPENLVDGRKMVDWPLPAPEETLGWCSDHYETRDVAVTVRLDLGEVMEADEIVMYPRGNGGGFFPEDYTVEVSEDGEKWDPIRAVSGDTVKGLEKRSFAFASRPLRYVKLHITRLSDDLDWIYYCAAVSEIEVWGRKEAVLELNKSELWMAPGAVDKLIPAIRRGDAGAAYAYTFEEDGTSLLRVEPDGTIEALACGNTAVRVTERTTGLTASCAIKVREPSGQDNIRITVPVWDNEEAVTRQQFLWLREADVDSVMAVGHNNTQQTNLEMLRLAKEIWDDGRERNLEVFIHSYNQGITPASTDKQILDYAAQYRNTPALAGYHVEDEPWYPQPYARVERLLRQADPFSIADINFRPGLVYGSFQEYRNKLADYAKLVGDAGSYLSFDNYPFTPAKGSVNENDLFGNFEAVRAAGLENGIPTAFYVQAIGSELYEYRRPDENVLRYHMASAMAYGFKWMKYFSWFVPGATGTDEMDDFTAGVMDRHGNKTDLYDAAARLNKQIHNVGDILVRLQAGEVYHTGSKSVSSVYQRLPAGFFVQPQGDNQAIVTLFTNPETGRQYLMLVNKDFTVSRTLRFTLAGVPSLVEIDKDAADGTLSPDYAGGVLKRTFLPGEFALYELPAGTDYSTPPPFSASPNRLLDAYATAGDSLGEDGWYIDTVNDGITASTPLSRGWKTVSKADTQWLKFRLPEKASFYELALFPADDGAFLPGRVTLAVSDDGESWTDVLAETTISKTGGRQAFRFEETSGRYIRLTLDDLTRKDGAYVCALAEVELLGDAQTPPTEPTVTVPSGQTTASTAASDTSPSASTTSAAASTAAESSAQTGAAAPILPPILAGSAAIAAAGALLLHRVRRPET